jgi:hypothetical protein
VDGRGGIEGELVPQRRDRHAQVGLFGAELVHSAPVPGIVTADLVQQAGGLVVPGGLGVEHGREDPVKPGPFPPWSGAASASSRACSAPMVSMRPTRDTVTTPSNFYASAPETSPTSAAATSAPAPKAGTSPQLLQLALRSIDMTSPMPLQGIRLHMDGFNDGYAIEAGIFQKWDSAKQSYVNQGNVIDLDGKAKLCAWDASAATCK